MAPKVLLVEDSPGDVRLTQEVFKAANSAVELHVTNLPRLDGREVLARIKQDDDLKSIPTVIMTTSEAGQDIAQSYRLQANCFLTKPVQLDEFEKLIKGVNEFWLTIAKLPQ